MKLLAIDPSKHNLGYAKFEGGTLAHVGHVSFSECGDLRVLLKAFRSWLAREVMGMDTVAYETARPRSYAHAEQHFGMVAMIHLTEVTIVPVASTAAKKRFTGSGKADKEAMLGEAQRVYPTHDIETHDQADAIAVGITAIDMLRELQVVA